MEVKTVYKKVNPGSPDWETLKEAGNVIRSGGLVAFPTETVYGLGANALDPDAASKIYTAKGRPADNPLIVHIAELEQIYNLAEDVTVPALRVMEAFWPGPLTVILPKKPVIPDQVTGGLKNVAVRMPNHPVALGIIRAAGVPVAAPSANSSGKPSPTVAEHVSEDLNGKIDMIVDGGPCQVGLESTVLDLTADPPVILRPGAITREDLEGVLGHVAEASSCKETLDAETAPKAPGMKYRHYSPEAPVIVVTGEDPNKIFEKIMELIQTYTLQNKKIGLLVPGESIAAYPSDFKYEIGTRENPETVARNLFHGLRWLDSQGVDLIIAEGYQETGVGRAVMNRLSKAAREIIEA